MQQSIAVTCRHSDKENALQRDADMVLFGIDDYEGQIARIETHYNFPLGDE